MTNNKMTIGQDSSMSLTNYYVVIKITKLREKNL